MAHPETWLFYQNESGEWCATNNDDMLRFEGVKKPPEWWLYEQREIDAGRYVRVVIDPDQWYYYTLLDIEYGWIGWRLKPLEKLKLRIAASRMWRIPF